MAEEEVEQAHVRYRRVRRKRKRKDRKHERLIYNLRWLLGGLAVGLPLLALLIWLASNI
jgi:uncharacterized membrane protein